MWMPVRPSPPIAGWFSPGSRTVVAHGGSDRHCRGKRWGDAHGAEANLDAAGVRLQKIGTSGATASYYSVVNAANWETGIASLSPSLVVLMFGANELQQNITPAAQASSLATIIANIQAAAPNADVILIPPVDIGVTGTYTVSAYAAAQQALAQSLGIGFMSMISGSVYAGSNARGLFNTDKIHFTATGGKVFANGLLRWLGSF